MLKHYTHINNNHYTMSQCGIHSLTNYNVNNNTLLYKLNTNT